jgi:hypothetical protein
VLLVVLAWCAVSPWLGLARAPAVGAVIAANEQLDQAPALLSRAAVADHLARLSRSDLGTALPVDQRPQRAIQAEPDVVGVADLDHQVHDPAGCLTRHEREAVVSRIAVEELQLHPVEGHRVALFEADRLHRDSSP